MATNHSLQKAKEWNREENLYDSSKKQVVCYWDTSQEEVELVRELCILFLI